MSITLRQILQTVEDTEDAQMAANASLELQQTEYLLKASCSHAGGLGSKSSLSSKGGLDDQGSCTVRLGLPFPRKDTMHHEPHSLGKLAQGDFQTKPSVPEKSEKMDWCAPELVKHAERQRCSQWSQGSACHDLFAGEFTAYEC